MRTTTQDTAGARLERIYLLVLATTLTLACLPFNLSPCLRDFLFAEDGLVETLSALFFLAAFLYAFRQGVSRSTARGLLLVLAAISLAGFLDEISFGERLFALRMPRIGATKIDAIHDLVDLAYFSWWNELSGSGARASTDLATACVFLIAGPAFLVALPATRRAFSQRHGRAILLGLGLLGFAIALDLDLDLVRRSLDFFAGVDPGSLAFLFPLEEVLELNVALSALVAVRLIVLRDGANQKPDFQTSA